jgi:hypothetical protein
MPEDAHEAALIGQAKVAAQEKLKETIERIKKRVLDHLGDAARNQMTRSGSARRA